MSGKPISPSKVIEYKEKNEQPIPAVTDISEIINKTQSQIGLMLPVKEMIFVNQSPFTEALINCSPSFNINQFSSDGGDAKDSN